VAADELGPFLRGLLGKGLDVLVPSQHGVEAFGTEDPRMSPMNAAGLSAFEDELGRASTDLRAGSQFLFREVEGHHRGLCLVRGLELVKVSWGENIPRCEGSVKVNEPERGLNLPAGTVALEVFRLSFKETGSDLLAGIMILPRVVYHL
jgi:hypothetical protein